MEKDAVIKINKEFDDFNELLQKPEGGFKRFQMKLITEMIPFLKEHGQKDILSKPRPGRETILTETNTRISEITACIESLELCRALVNQKPPRSIIRKAKSNETKYLRYHIEHYFEELYILEQRLSSFTKWIDRKLKAKGHDLSPIKTLMAITLVEKMFEDIKGVRGEHVHAGRFDTAELLSLSVFDIAKDAKFVSEDTLLDMNNIIEKRLGLEREKWAQKISESLKTSELLIDAVFVMLFDPYFTDILPRYTR